MDDSTKRVKKRVKNRVKNALLDIRRFRKRHGNISRDG